MALLPAILDIEYQVYEPARRTPPAEIRAALEDPEGSTVIAEAAGPSGRQLVGFGLGTPLEHAASVEGPHEDGMLGKQNTMYSVSITVAAGYQSSGIGRKLKAMQLRDAMSRRRPDGTPRYRYVTGRNRVGRTAQMTHLNRVFGAHVVSVLTGQYDDPEGQAIYYRIPLGALRPDPEVRPTRTPEPGPRFDLATGLIQPFSDGPPSLRQAEAQGLLYGPAVNKLTLMNYTTPATVRAMEWVSALLPELPHMYLTSSRDEALDKALRLIRVTRKTAQVVIALEGNYYGHTVGTTRSLSDPSTHQGGPGHFAWPRVPHPAIAGTAATLEAIRAAVAAAGGGAHCYGLCYELVGERTGLVLPQDFLDGLATLRRELDLPLIAVEHASHSYRSGRGPFLSSAVGLTPDVLVWWPGGQTGYVHCTARWFVPGPLTLVSTWDGDELSLVRHHHYLRAARAVDLAPGIAALDRAMAVFAEHNVPTAGLGLYRVASAGDRAGAIAARLAKLGVRARQFPGGRLAFAPAFDQAKAAADALTSALRGAF